MAGEKASEVLVCPKCGKQAIYYRKDGSIRCNRCGYEGKIKEEK